MVELTASVPKNFPEKKKRSLRKSDKLKTRKDFESVKESGRRVSDAFFTLLALPGDASGFRFGIICSRKFSKNAVVRNRARRLLSESLRLLKPRILPCRVILIPRRKICDALMPQVMDKVDKALETAGFLTNSPNSVSNSLPGGSF